MFRHAFLLLALPMTGLAAQSSGVYVTITASNNTEFRIVQLVKDAALPVVVGRGRMETQLSPGVGAEAFTVFTTDSSSRVHVEVSEGDRRLMSAEGAYVTVRRDLTVSIEASDRAPESLSSVDLRKQGNFGPTPTSFFVFVRKPQ
jgi:hypothetical protein